MASKEQRKLRHWLDAEFTIMHIYVLVVIWLLTDGWLPHTIVGVLIVLNAVYTIKRALWLASVDKHYLKIPPIKTAAGEHTDGG